MCFAPFHALQELFSMVKRAAVQASNPVETPGKRATAQAAAAVPNRQLLRTDSGTVTLDKDVFWFAAQVGRALCRIG
jgi:hypothetical protein